MTQARNDCRILSIDDAYKKTCGLIICDGEFPMQFPNKDIFPNKNILFFCSIWIDFTSTYKQKIIVEYTGIDNDIKFV